MYDPVVLIVFALFYSHVADAQGSGSLWASWVPLAVRSPYLSTWMNTTNIPFNTSDVDGVLRAPTTWPQFLQGQHTAWAGMIRIDQTQTFMWLSDPLAGRGLNRSIITNIQVTPTRTIMNMTAGSLDLTVTFLSPIEPADPVLQSLPFSYVALEAISNDGQQHDVQVYLDTSGEWLSGNRSQSMNWVNQLMDKIVYSQFDLVDPRSLIEIDNQADDATLFYAMPLMPSQTFMINFDQNCRPQFRQHGTLNNQIMNGPLPIQSNLGFPISAMSVDLGNISMTQEPIVWAVGINRDPAIGYVTGDGTSQQRSPYWVSEFSTVQDAMTAFVTGFQEALTRAIALDDKIMTAASSVSAHYSDLVSLAARQAMGGTELTVGQGSESSTLDIKMFMKDTGASSSRVNPVEGIYASLPFFLYVNATYIGWLLEPVLDFASSDRWSFTYAPKDLGNNYPNATGDSSSHNQGVEQSGNMLIMTLVHARATGDGTLITRYYNALRQWTEYLVNNSLPLEPSQVSADTTDTKGSLVNLALKGIIGIRAMSEISAIMDREDDSRRYLDISTLFATRWQAQAVSSDGLHFVTSLNDSNSSLALTYNLFADKLLMTNVVPSHLYTSQTQALKTFISASEDGVPVDGGLPNQSNTVWSMFAAAYTDDIDVQQSVVDQIWGRISNNATDIGIFPTVYELDAKNTSINTASPFIGGVFAPLSLNVPNVTITIPPPTPTTSSATRDDQTSQKSIPVKTIVGAVIGGVGGAILLGIIGFAFWRRMRPHTSSSEVGPTLHVTPFSYDVTAYGSHSDIPPISKQQAEKTQHTHSIIHPHTAASVPSISLPSYPTPSAAASDRTQQQPPALVGHVYSQWEVQGLLTEVENLRQVVRSLGDDELPPEYRSQLASQSGLP